jgi:hypothetical protein
MKPFDQRWQRLVRAARQAPAERQPTLDVARILAARQRPIPRPAVLRIGWFPPGLAAAALLALLFSVAAGLDPRPAAFRAGSFLVDLPLQVPHAPALAPPVAMPRAADVLAYLPPVTLPSPISFMPAEEPTP